MVIHPHRVVWSGRRKRRPYVHGLWVTVCRWEHSCAPICIPQRRPVCVAYGFPTPDLVGASVRAPGCIPLFLRHCMPAKECRNRLERHRRAISLVMGWFPVIACRPKNAGIGWRVTGVQSSWLWVVPRTVSRGGAEVPGMLGASLAAPLRVCGCVTVCRWGHSCAPICIPQQHPECSGGLFPHTMSRGDGLVVAPRCMPCPCASARNWMGKGAASDAPTCNTTALCRTPTVTWPDAQQ